MSKKPRFFCDNCGKEVGRDSKACPHCGRFFAMVRCPSCGFTGKEAAFLNGCPSCSYAITPARQPPVQDTPDKPLPLVHAGKLPLWVYILSICAFIGVCLLVYFRLIR